MNKYFRHFKLITNHKWLVFKASCRAGIPVRGFLHDLSKYSPTEFFGYAKYFTGNGSPVDECKRINGSCPAWQHHKGHNPHHWEYWVDQLSSGGVGTLMPYKYCVEMICDYIGAGQAYEKNKWTFDRPYDYWRAQTEIKEKIHPDIVRFMDTILLEMKRQKNYKPIKSKHTREVYTLCTGREV